MATHPKMAKSKEQTKTAAQAATVPAALPITATTEASAPRVDGLAAPAPAPTAAAPASASRPVDTKEKILVALDEQGGIDFGSMREKTKERFVKALRRSETEIFPKSTTDAAVMSIPDEAVSAIFNLVGVGETMLASARGVPPDIASQVFMWSRPEVDAIKGPAKAVIAKHARRLRGWEEETTLALVFVQIHFGKMHMLRTLMADLAATKAAAAATPGPKLGDNKAGLPGNISPSDPLNEGPKVQ